MYARGMEKGLGFKGNIGPIGRMGTYRTYMKVLKLR